MTTISGEEEKRVLERVLERAAEAKTKFTYGDKQSHVKKHDMRYVPAHIVYDKKVWTWFDLLRLTPAGSLFRRLFQANFA
jgi:hypothetical protein